VILGDFLSPEAGQQRKAWLNSVDDRIDETLAYYLGPQLMPRVRGAAGAVQAMSPGQDVVDAYTASGDLVRPGSTALDRAGAGATLAGALMMMGMPGGVSSLRQGFNNMVDAGVRAYDPNTVNIFAGPRAKTADLAALDRAKSMAETGASRDAIWSETGWFRGADGDWRFEIDDSGMENDIAGAATEVESGVVLPLDAVIEHKKLFAAYPEIADTPTRLYPKEDLDKIYPGTYGGITENRHFVFRDDLLDTGRPVHELQHIVQSKEGFPGGGSPLDIGVDDYLRLSGEVEARNAEMRSLFDSELRRANPPWETQDFPDGKQIISAVKKYGIAGAAAMLGLSAAEVEAQVAQQPVSISRWLEDDDTATLQEYLQ
jgi:hypothetical protein